MILSPAPLPIPTLYLPLVTFDKELYPTAVLLNPAATPSNANLPSEVLFFAALVVAVDGEPMKTEVALDLASPKSSTSNSAITSALAASAAVALAISAAIAVAFAASAASLSDSF